MGASVAETDGAVSAGGRDERSGRFLPGNSYQRSRAGSRNNAAIAFKDAIVRLAAEPDTLAALVRLRDSDQSADRATFWGLMKRLVPQAIEVAVKSEPTLRIVDLTSTRGDKPVEIDITPQRDDETDET